MSDNDSDVSVDDVSKYKCELCGQDFSSNDVLKWHQMAVHNIDVNKNKE